MGDMMDLWFPPKPAIIRPAGDELRRDWRRPADKASFAPGWFPAGAVAPSELRMSFITHTTSTGTTITAPASILPGDMLILFQYCNDVDNVPSNVVPSGWTNITGAGDAGSATRVSAQFKVAAGNEDGTSITGMNGVSTGNANTYKHILQFRCTVPIVSATAESANADLTTGNPVARSITTTGGTAPVVALGNYSANANVSIRDFNGATADAELGGLRMYTKYKIFNPSDTLVDLTVDMTDDGGEQNVTGLYMQPAFV